MIKWESLRERHVRGTCKRGVVWIRLNQKDRVTGVYLMFNSVVKLIPLREEEETLTGAMRLAEDELKLMDWAEELADAKSWPT